MKCVLKHQDLQMFRLKLNRHKQFLLQVGENLNYLYLNRKTIAKTYLPGLRMCYFSYKVKQMYCFTDDIYIH